MDTQDIPASDWASVLDDFSQTHVDQQTDIDTLRTGTSAIPQARGLPFLGVTLAHDPSGKPEIEVMAGDRNGPQIGHVIHNPIRIRLATWNDGYSARLEIESADGQVTQIAVGRPDELMPRGTVTGSQPPISSA